MMPITGTERLFAHDAHIARDVREDGRFEVESFAFNFLSAHEHGGAFNIDRFFYL